MGEALRMLARLNADTEVHHGDADRDLDHFLFRAQTTRRDYQAYLVRIYGFLAPVEAALAQAPGLEDVIDVTERAKAPLVLHDLLSLGLTMKEAAELPQCLSIPTFRGPAAALGWLYVIERPTLANAVVRGHLTARLRVEMATGSHYLSCYAGQAGMRWRELGRAMDRVATTPGVADRIVAAAREAFMCHARWRLHEPQGMPGLHGLD